MQYSTSKESLYKKRGGEERKQAYLGNMNGRHEHVTIQKGELCSVMQNSLLRLMFTSLHCELKLSFTLDHQA